MMTGFTLLLFTMATALLPQRNFALQNDLVAAESKNNSITPANILEENRKQVNDVYLKTHAVQKLEFDAVQQATLESIACQNPLEGGEGVYSARAMLRQSQPCGFSARKGFIDNENNNEDETEPGNSYFIDKIYPNPNDGTMQINYFLKEEGLLKIYDITGQLISVHILHSNMNNLQINQSIIGNGIYFYEINIKDKIILKDKLIIIK